MKRLMCLLVVVGFFLCSTSALGDGDKEKMEKWTGIHVDSFIGAKIVDTPGENSHSAYGNIIIYPWAWTTEDGLNLAGIGYKANFWESPSGHGERHLGQLAFRGYRDWGNYRLALLGGIQKEDYGRSHPRYNLFGIGGYLSLNHKDLDGNKVFPKTEIWAQALYADGRNKKSTIDGIIDIGGRQYLYEGDFKPFFEANLSIGTPDKYASLAVGLGITDKNEIFFIQVGPQFDLKNGEVFSFVNAGLDTSNLVSWLIRQEAKEQVKKAH